ncbi:MAG: PH domain-containing protein [Planctomycetaceae bacterium]|nr:PH domain-containing protein [Planctomycetaceae bacterium]
MSTAHDERVHEAPITYECPFCRAKNRVERALIGEQVDCVSCGNPFHADPPHARPISASPDDPDTQGTPIIDHASEHEFPVAEVHPAMFRNHPGKFALTVGLAIVGGVVAITSLVQPSSLAVNGDALISSSLALAAGGAMAVAGIAVLVAWWVQTRFVTLTVTTDRTIYRRGLLSKSTSEVQHDDVRNLRVEQNVFDRLFHVGRIEISSSGQDDMEIVANGIPNPNKLAEMVRDHQ